MATLAAHETVDVCAPDQSEPSDEAGARLDLMAMQRREGGVEKKQVELATPTTSSCDPPLLTSGPFSRPLRSSLGNVKARSWPPTHNQSCTAALALWSRQAPTAAWTQWQDVATGPMCPPVVDGYALASSPSDDGHDPRGQP